MRSQLVGALAAGVAVAVIFERLTRRRPQRALRHVVQLSFTDGAPTDAIIEAFDAMVRAMPDLIVSYERGTQCSPEPHTKGLTHVFVLTFPSAEARDAYLPHPVHEAFAKRWIAPHLQSLQVSDYFAEVPPRVAWR